MENVGRFDGKREPKAKFSKARTRVNVCVCFADKIRCGEWEVRLSVRRLEDRY